LYAIRTTTEANANSRKWAFIKEMAHETRDSLAAVGPPAISILVATEVEVATSTAALSVANPGL
jgi:hypothetical protein